MVQKKHWRYCEKVDDLAATGIPVSTTPQKSEIMSALILVLERA
jgi:hypothetical protein